MYVAWKFDRNLQFRNVSTMLRSRSSINASFYSFDTVKNRSCIGLMEPDTYMFQENNELVFCFEV